MRKDALRLLVAHDVHCWDIGATPLPILEVRANGAQATFLLAVLRLLMCEVSDQFKKSRLALVRKHALRHELRK